MRNGTIFSDVVRMCVVKRQECLEAKVLPMVDYCPAFALSNHKNMEVANPSRINLDKVSFDFHMKPVYPPVMRSFADYTVTVWAQDLKTRKTITEGMNSTTASGKIDHPFAGGQPVSGLTGQMTPAKYEKTLEGTFRALLVSLPPFPLFFFPPLFL